MSVFVWLRIAAVVVVVVALALAAVVSPLAGIAASVARSKPKAVGARPFSYCAHLDATFKDRQPFIGVSDPSIGPGTPQYRNCTFGRMAAAHVGYFRDVLSWPAVESSPQQYDFAFYDALIGDLARHHLRFLPVLLGAPGPLSTQPAQGALPGAYPPRDPSQFAYFASLCVLRYGPGGAFWRTHPALPYYPIRAWEIWNEPNLTQYWEPKPDPRAYVRLLRAASTAIKRADPHAVIVLAGMPFLSAPAETSLLSQLYRDGARGAFDALGLHSYSVTVGGALQRLKDARAVMNRFGDRQKAIWLTEWGWAGGPPNPYLVNQAGQRANVAAFLKLVQRYRARLGLRELIYFDWHDAVFGPGPKNYWVYHLGLLTGGLRPKPALSAFTLAALRLDR